MRLPKGKQGQIVADEFGKERRLIWLDGLARLCTGRPQALDYRWVFACRSMCVSKASRLSPLCERRAYAIVVRP